MNGDEPMTRESSMPISTISRENTFNSEYHVVQTIGLGIENSLFVS